MARDLLENVVRLGGPLDRPEASAALDRLPAERVAPDGRIAEWRDDVPEAEPEHRHQSHLFRVHPGTSIDPDQAPDLARAALATLDARGPESTGWSLAWRLNLRARLRDPAGAARDDRRVPAPGRPGRTTAGASTRTCSAPTPRSRSTATSASRPASPSCCSSRTP